MATEFVRDDYFKLDPEAHMVGRMEPFNHFPGVRMWWKAIESTRRPLLLGTPPAALDSIPPADLQVNADPEALLAAMDRYGVDIACILPESMMDTTGYSSRWVTNGDMAAVVDKHPNRFLYEPNLSPIKFRGVKNAIWELEYWVKEKGARIFKFYPPEDTYINDPDLWPFYTKAEELRIVLDIHTGFSWVPPGKSKYALPILLDDVARDFPELKIVAFHMGYPYCDDLNMVALGPSERLPVPLAADPMGTVGAAKVRTHHWRGTAFRRTGTDYLGDGLRRLRRADRGRDPRPARLPDPRGHATRLRLPVDHGRGPAQDLR